MFEAAFRQQNGPNSRHPATGLRALSLTQAEVFYGLAMLPEGRRREGLIEAARDMFEVDLAGRILRDLVNCGITVVDPWATG